MYVCKYTNLLFKNYRSVEEINYRLPLYSLTISYVILEVLVIIGNNRCY